MDGRGGDEDQVRRLEARHPVVQIDKAGSQSRHCGFGTGGLLDLIQNIQGHLADGDKIAAGPALEQMEDLFFRVCQDRIQRLLSRIAGIGDLFVDLDQAAKDRLLVDNGGIGPHIGRRGHRSHDVPDGVQAAYLRRHVLFLQPVLEGHQIHRLAFVEQLHHGLEHDAVLALVKLIGHDGL